MKIECLNTIKRQSENKWEYNGRFYFNRKWIPVIGTVADYKTESQIKRAIIRRIKSQADTHKEKQKKDQTKILGVDKIFKDALL